LPSCPSPVPDRADRALSARDSGLILVILTLFDADRPINLWLEENLQISYQLAVIRGLPWSCCSCRRRS